MNPPNPFQLRVKHPLRDDPPYARGRRIVEVNIEVRQEHRQALERVGEPALKPFPNGLAALGTDAVQRDGE